MQFRVVKVGSHAEAFLRRHCVARVAAVFERSLHLEAEGDLLCVGGPGLGDGPLNVIVDAGLGAGWLSAARHAGRPATIAAGYVDIGDVRLDTRAADIWQPAEWPRHWLSEDVEAGVGTIEEIALAVGPADGMALLALGLDERASSPLARVAAPRIALLCAWLAAQSGEGGSHRSELDTPTGLLGLGPGLTPSGDDVLCGVLIALHAAGKKGAALELAAAIARDAPRKTSALSGAFMRAAADGLGSEALHSAIIAILGGDVRGLPGLVDQLSKIGHTSGWDGLAGAAIALRACASTGPSTRFP